MSAYAATTIPTWITSNQEAPPLTFMPEKPVDTDIQDMQALAKGDDAALSKIIDRWQRPLINFFYRNTKNTSDAEDLTQLVFVRLYRAAHRYEPKARFSTYLFQIARRLLLNHYRSQKRKPLDPVDPVDLNDSVISKPNLETWELEDVFAQALEALPENQRTALLLLTQQELSYDEIAKIMDAPVSSIKTWIYRARQHMKSCLESANKEC